ncbi:dynein beta chain, ciliary-like, partial [Saccoglossus kowalevskii]|uniref:Dynein beta chain, ciliary-like n=1 Tax=Saccoglossus kowalevskii TaxID=10224 RepID=A0ABM0M9U0_SACKO
IMDNDFAYGYEYIGSANRIVMTPMTERVFVSLTQAVKSNMGGLCVGPNWSGRREIIHELSMSLGRPLYMFNCSKTLDSFMLADIFKGLSCTGAWICLNNIANIKPDVLSICAQLLQTILESFKAGKTNVTIQSDEIILNPLGACFGTISDEINIVHNNPEKHLLFNSSVTSLPPNLVKSFRIVSVSKPDFRISLEVMLLSQGFLSASELSYKLLTLQELASNLLSTVPPIAVRHHTFSPKLSQGWSLQTMESIIQEAGSILDESLNAVINEEIIIEETVVLPDDVASTKLSSEVGTEPEQLPPTEHKTSSSVEPDTLGSQQQPPTETTENGQETIIPTDEKRYENDAVVLAIRDSTMPKLHGRDSEVFIRMLQDLFPDVDVPLDFGGNEADKAPSNLGEIQMNTPVVNMSSTMCTQAFTPSTTHDKQPLEDMNEAIAVSTAELGLMPGAVFQARVAQFALLTNTHQCVLVVGPAGCGKSECINTYVGAQREMGKTVNVQRVFTRAVESQELLGYIDPSTKEWRDGLFQTLIRKHCLHANTEFLNSKPLVKVVHMDGEVDEHQMEVLGCVFNRNNNDVLVMGNNERIRLSDSVRVLWEMESLANVSPAVLSKVGILSMDMSDVGWRLIVARWLDSRPEHEQDVLKELMDVYVEGTLLYLGACTQPAIMGRTGQPRMKRYINTSDMNMVSTLCTLMEALISQQNDLDDLQYERYFNFAAIWAFGGTLEEQYRSTFSHWWRNQWQTRVDYPEQGEVWDYFVDSETNDFIHWQDAVPAYSMPPHEGIPNDAFVHTVSVEQISYLLGLLSDAGKPVMLVGENGCGKTGIVNDRIRTVCSGEVAEVLALNVHANRFTTAHLLWQRLEERLEWKHGRTYVPKGNKKLMCFVDDLNLAKVCMQGFT